MAAGAAAHRKPVALHTLAPASPAAAVLRAAGIPVFRALDDAVRTLALLAARRRPAGPRRARPARARRRRWRPTTTGPPASCCAPPACRSRRPAASPAPTRRWPPPPSSAAPVALKALGLLHKSDAGGVALGLATEAGASARAHAAMAARLHPPAFVVERMADTRDGVELIAGVRRDPRFGPVVMVGLGGLFTEALHDVAFALAPVEEDDVPALLDALAGAPLLRGARGRPPVDVAAVAARRRGDLRGRRRPSRDRRAGGEPAARPPGRVRGARRATRPHDPELTMDFAYTPRLLELKHRAAELRERIVPYEEPCELAGGLSDEDHADIREAVLETGLQAINMPQEWGGAGLGVLEQVVVQEELGKLTGALWDCVWRPANALRACTPAQRERYLLPGIRGERRDAVAITEAARRLGPAGHPHDGDARPATATGSTARSGS